MRKSTVSDQGEGWVWVSGPPPDTPTHWRRRRILIRGDFSRPACTLSPTLSRNLTGEGPEAGSPQRCSQSAFIDSLWPERGYPNQSINVETRTTGWKACLSEEYRPKIRRAAREGCPLFFRPSSPHRYGVPPAGAPPAGAPPAGAPPPAGAASGAGGGAASGAAAAGAAP
jgi:hypothetical protein